MTEDLQILGELIAEQAAHMDAAEHRLLTNIREFDRQEGWNGATSCAHWLSWRVGWTLGTAREHVRVAKALGSLPHIDEALRVGKVSYCKVRAMTRVATPQNEQVLLMDAGLTTGSQLERVCRKYRQLRRNVEGANAADDDLDRYLRRRDLDNGMVRIEAVCHPEEAALIWAAIEQATKEVYAARRTDTAMASADAACDQSAHVSAETCVVRDAWDDTPYEETSSDEDTSFEGVPAETREGASSTRAVVHDCVGSSDAYGACEDANLQADGTDADGTDTDGTDTDGTDADGTDADGTDADGIDDADDVYEDDCMFFERFGVCPEPRSEPICRGRDDDPPPTTSTVTTRQPESTSLTRANASVRPRPNRLDGLLALVRKYACGESSRTPVEVVVTVSAEALACQAAAGECIALVDGDGCVSAETARRMSCDAGIVRMVEDEHGNPLSVGRRTRSIPTSIGRALRKRDTCCRFPGCTNRLYVDGHHIKHWALGGETSLKNLVLLCDRHHRFVHEYGYRIEVDAGGQPQFFDPCGRPALDIPTRILREDMGWPHILEANRELGIESQMCGWTGERISYDDVCHALYLVDEGLLEPEELC
jgi:hypothetical protein